MMFQAVVATWQWPKSLARLGPVRPVFDGTVNAVLASWPAPRSGRKATAAIFTSTCK